MADAQSLLTGPLDFLHRDIHVCLRRFPGADRLGWCPTPGFFTLFELGAHLSACPAFMAGALRGDRDGEVHKWDVPVRQGTQADLGRLLDGDTAALRAGSDGEAFLTAGVPAPFGAAPAAGHLLNLITHMHHHRGNSTTICYVCELGTGVGTGTLYAAGWVRRRMVSGTCGRRGATRRSATPVKAA